jgi:hypothetical protein
MPSIMIVAHTANGDEAAVFLAERLTTVQLDDAHFAAQLVERLTWAGEDAEHAEREVAIRTPRMDQAHPPVVGVHLDRHSAGDLPPPPCDAPARQGSTLEQGDDR